MLVQQRTLVLFPIGHGNKPLPCHSQWFLDTLHAAAGSESPKTSVYILSSHHFPCVDARNGEHCGSTISLGTLGANHYLCLFNTGSGLL